MTPVTRAVISLMLCLQPFCYLSAQQSNADIRGIGIAAVGTGYWGPCPVMVHYRATIYATKTPLKIEYSWVRSDGTKTAPVRTTISGAEPKLNVSDDWAAGEPTKRFSTWNELHVTTANGEVISDRATSDGRCRDVAENKEGCLASASKLLRGNARILKVGDLSDRGVENGTFQCLAVLPLQDQKSEELLIRRGAILEFRNGRWDKVLDIGDHVKNHNGYIGVDYLDSSTQFGYAISVKNKRSDNVSRFTIFLTYLNEKRQPEGTPIEISWNSNTGRYQEFAPNELDPPGFRPEVANPPIRK